MSKFLADLGAPKPIQIQRSETEAVKKELGVTKGILELYRDLFRDEEKLREAFARFEDVDGVIVLRQQVDKKRAQIRALEGL